MMKRVLFLTHNCNFANNFLLPQFDLYEELGYETALASSLDLDNPSEQIKKFYDIGIKQSPFRFIENYRAFKKLKYIIDCEQIDVVNAHTPVGGLLGRLLKIPYPNLEVVYTAHGFHFFNGSSIINWIIYYPIEKFLSRFTDKQITINKEDYKVMIGKNFRSINKYFVNGVGVARKSMNCTVVNQIKKKYDLDGAITLISIGQLNDNKNHIFIVNSFIEARKLKPNLKLLILGRGYLETNLIRIIKQNNLSESIFLVGYVDNVVDYLVASDILVSASLREGLPKNVMEALAEGKPCLVSDVRGNHDIIESGLNGYVMKELTVKEFIKGLTFIESNYEQLSEKSFETSKKYLVNNVMKDYRYIFEEKLK